MKVFDFLVVALLLVCESAIVQRALACNASKNCASCASLDLVETAAANARSIQAMLRSKKCENWRNLKFRVVAISAKGHSSCRTSEGHPLKASEEPQCEVAELLNLAIDEEISAAASSPVVDDLARDGQLECEPNGVMVFNRGRTRSFALDSLFEPALFRPAAFSTDAKLTVGFEVILSNQLSHSSNSMTRHWCYKVSSTSLIFYDVVDRTGKSVLPVSA